jgi:hypothetical protein
MICLDIRIKNGYGNFLYQIFNGINLLNYIWKINTDDVLYDENQGIFDGDILEGESFYKCISKDHYYMIFVDIKAYPIGDECTVIKTIDDFLASSCELVFLCTDSTFIEVYCKDSIILDKIYSNCTGVEFEKVHYKSKEEVLLRNLIAF